jgi:glycosyltransferase involved in cell wall biosynthesis
MTGTGAKAAPLQEAVRRQGLASFVFQDYQPPEMLGDSMAASQVHLVSLLPALEGLIVPSKLYGILAAGRPTVFIGDPQGDVANLIRERDCGIAVPVGDSEGLARQLRSLRDDRGRLESMGRRARQFAVEQFSGEQAAAAWLKFLAECRAA